MHYVDISFLWGMSGSGASGEASELVSGDGGVVHNAGSTDGHTRWVSMFTESRGKPGLSKVIADYTNPFNVYTLHASGDCPGFENRASCYE
jgi:hypothetical protein